MSFSTPDKHGLLGKPRSPRLDQFRREKGLTSMAWLKKFKMSELNDKQPVPHHLLLPKMIQAWGEDVTPKGLVTNVQGLLSRIQATLGNKSLSCLEKERRDKSHDALDHPLVMKEHITRRGGPKRGVEEREIPLCMPFVKRKIGKGASILKDGYLYILLDKGDKGVRRGVYEYAHRIVCFAYHGPPPPNKTYCLHRCYSKGRQTDSYDCLSPLHLEWGTPKENSIDRDRKKRRNPRNV